MIRSFYGLKENPFSPRQFKLLPQQQEIYDTLRVHCQQGGLCLVLGSPGTGKSAIKETIAQSSDNKRQLVASVARTLHTYHNTVKILCDAFNTEFDGDSFKCEKRLINEALSLNRLGKTLITIIDDAHLMEMNTLRRLRLLFEDFPKNHNLVLFGQPELLGSLALSVNQDLKSRVTYSVITRRLNPDDMQAFILAELDRLGLGHNTFTQAALDLIVRSAEGILRKTRNICLACMLEAVRANDKTIDIENVNRVLIQPHWRKECDLTEF